MDDPTRMKLNYDILFLVSCQLMQLWPYLFKDVTVMSRTCRRLYLECFPLLLTPRHIRVGGERNIVSFCLFMSSYTTQRVELLSHCPSVEFSGKPLSDHATDILIETLGRITTLQCLRLQWFEELQPSPRLFLAFSAFTGTQYLEITTIKIRGQTLYDKLLKETRAPLKGVKLALGHNTEKGMGHVRYNRNLDPIWLFSSLSSTLESIHLYGPFAVDACSKIHVYPRLTHLTVPQHGMPLVRPYVSAFPCLRILHFNYDSFLWDNPFPTTKSLSECTFRNRSCEELRRFNREDQLAHGSWTALEYFMATTFDAYMVGLTCRVPKLHLISWGPGIVEGEISAICTIFAVASPSHFRLALRSPQIDLIHSLFNLRADLFSSLVSLELGLTIITVPFDFNSCLVNIGSALQHLTITSLQVEIKCLVHLMVQKSYEDPLPCEHPDRMEEAPCYTLTALAGEDMEGHMRCFLQKIRTLRRVTIAWSRCWRKVAYHIMSIDLDNIPHHVDRPGRPTDNFWKDGY